MKTLFVSSTFKDMQYERDAIHQIVLPKLNSIAKRYGQALSICDLRWGINTMELDNDEGSKKVLDVCLDKIDRCASPMIVLLGDRYGYIPDSSIIKDVASYKRLKLEDLEISVTALEIEYGAMSEKQKKNTLFYFREMSGAPADYLGEDAEHAEKLSNLKNRIIKLAGDKVRKYSVNYVDGKPDGMDEFADMLASDVTAVLLPEWEAQASMSNFALERKTQWDFIEDRNAVCRGRKKLLSDITAKIYDSNRMVALKGDSGSGKSVVFSKLAVTLRDAGWDVLPFVGGLTTESNDATDIIRNTIVYLQSKLNGVDPDALVEECYKLKFGELRSQAEVLIKQYCESGGKFIIMVDAVDQLYDDSTRNSLAFIPDVTTGGFRVFITFNSDFKELEVGSIPISPLSNEEKEEVIRGTLERYDRELDKSVIAYMVALKNSDNPLYLSFLIKRLLMMYKYDFDIINSRGGHIEAISDYQRELIAKCPKTTDALCALLLEEAGKHINQQLVSKTLNYIACSRFGLRETDLSVLLNCEWNSLDFAHFVAYMGDCFIMRDDGRYDFPHKSIRQGLVEKLDLQAENKKILDYLLSLDDDDILKTEIFYHIMMADDKESFRALALKIVSDSNNSDNEQIVNSIVRYIVRACEFVGEYGGAWFVDVIRTTPVTEEMLSFVTFMCTVSLNMSTLLFSPNATHVINIALKDLSDQFIERGIKGATDIQPLIAFSLGQSFFANNSDEEATEQFSDAYDKLLAKYRLTPTADIAVQLLVAARSYFFSMSIEEIESDRALDVLTVIDELYETSKEEYASSRTAVNARNLFVCNSTIALINIMSNALDEAESCVEENKAILQDCLDLFTGIIDIRNMIELNDSCGTVIVEKIGEIDIDKVDQDDTKDNTDYVDAEADRIVDKIQTAGSLEEAGQGLKELFDLLNADNEFDESNFGNHEPNDWERLEKLAKIGTGVFDLSATLATYAVDKLGVTNCLPENSVALMNKAVIELQLGNGEVSAQLLRKALDVLKKAEEDGVTPMTRQLAHEIKAMLLNVEFSLGSDSDILLPLARDIARDAENLSASDLSGIDIGAQVTANTTVLNLILKKCYDCITNGLEIDEGTVSEVKYWFDKTEKLLSSNRYIDESFKEDFATLKEALDEILSGNF